MRRRKKQLLLVAISFPFHNKVVRRFLTKDGLVTIIAGFLAFSPALAWGNMYYVNGNNPTPLAPYTNWTSAAISIQDAIDSAAPGDTVLVTNGIYQTGGRVVSGLMTNRVVVDKALVVQSVNGPQNTVIKGYSLPTTTTNGDGAIRCIYLADGATLIGFTLMNGATRTSGAWDSEQSGGGAWCNSTNAYLVNCIIEGNACWDSGGGVVRGTLSNCVLRNNSSMDNVGGGAFGGILNYCILDGNFANYGGGGTYGQNNFPCTMNHCTLINNFSSYSGGGSWGATLDFCVISNNFATDDYYPGESYGGGIIEAHAYNCVIADNTALFGGGASSSDLFNCLVVGNRASVDGGGVESCLARNCTVIENLADNAGGGSDSSDLNNCIVYYNTASSGPNVSAESGCSHCTPINYTCTTPLPTGVGNITAEPQLADAFHLSATSPCRGAGSSASTTGTDIDGQPWAYTPSLGCDEFYSGTMTGALTAVIAANYTNVAAGFPVNFKAEVAGHASANQWNFGDSTVASNRLFVSHSWLTPGDYNVAFTVFNETLPGGFEVTVSVHVVEAPVLFVDPASPAPTPPFNSWATAATHIQDAIDASALPGSIVLVTNGTFQTGGTLVHGTMLNRIALSKPITVQSVNGPAVTTIHGAQPNGANAIRCAYVTNGATLIGFTLMNGGTRTNGDETIDQSGGGVWSEAGGTISNCVLSGNSAGFGGGSQGGNFFNCNFTSNASLHEGGGARVSILDKCSINSNIAGGYGGGVNSSTAIDCTFTANSTTSWGGGAAHSLANNCLFTGNFASGTGGATYSSMVKNCIITNNSAASSGGGTAFGSVDGSLIISNSAGGNGGGAAFGALKNCSISSNSAAGSGGGVFSAVMNNSIVYYNSASSDPNYGTFCSGCYSVNYCCLTSVEPGAGNFTNAPLFVNVFAGNLRLQSNSPCINSGKTADASAGPDLDLNPRIAGGAVDLGAYEFQSPPSMISLLWLTQYGFSTDGSADFLDPDGDGSNNLQEWRAGTDPTNSLSVFRMLTPLRPSPGVAVRWESVPSRTYFLERALNPNDHTIFSPIAGNIAGQPGTTSYTDTNVVPVGAVLYRVGVQE